MLPRNVEHPAPHVRVERGQAVTEIAMFLPILCALLLAIIQFGLMIWSDMELASATRDGARHAVVARVEPNPTAAVTQTVRNSLENLDGDDVAITVSGGWDRDDQVTVTATTPYTLNIVGFQIWSGSLRSASTVRIG